MIKISSSPVEKINQYEIIPDVVNLIINKIEPKMIILFGSCARGLATIYSDIDLCIVVEGKIEPKERAKLRSVLLVDILEITDYEIDIFICGQGKWEQNHKDQSTFIGKIYKEGKLLYGR